MPDQVTRDLRQRSTWKRGRGFKKSDKHRTRSTTSPCRVGKRNYVKSDNKGFCSYCCPYMAKSVLSRLTKHSEIKEYFAACESA